MKTHLALILAAFAALLVPTQAADTPASIATDYRAKAETALTRLNGTLDAEAAKVSKTLLALNDPAAVQSLAEQVQAKRAGEPVAQPVPQAVALFASYDRARSAALAPVQQTTLRRIEAMLASSDGQKTEIVAELAKIKIDVEVGLIVDHSAPPPHWTFHRTRSGPADGAVVFGSKGDVTFISKVGNKSAGTWTRTKEDTVLAKFPTDEWKISFRKSGTEVRTTTGQDICYLQPSKP
jgi:hypothetical protein